jgi:hypothetical protein
MGMGSDADMGVGSDAETSGSTSSSDDGSGLDKVALRAKLEQVIQDRKAGKPRPILKTQFTPKENVNKGRPLIPLKTQNEVLKFKRAFDDRYFSKNKKPAGHMGGLKEITAERNSRKAAGEKDVSEANVRNILADAVVGEPEPGVLDAGESVRISDRARGLINKFADDKTLDANALDIAVAVGLAPKLVANFLKNPQTSATSTNEQRRKRVLAAREANPDATSAAIAKLARVKKGAAYHIERKHKVGKPLPNTVTDGKANELARNNILDAYVTEKGFQAIAEKNGFTAHVVRGVIKRVRTEVAAAQQQGHSVQQIIADTRMPLKAVQKIMAEMQLVTAAVGNVSTNQILPVAPQEQTTLEQSLAQPEMPDLGFVIPIHDVRISEPL